MRKLFSFLSFALITSVIVLSCSKSSEDEESQAPGGGSGGGGTTACDTVAMTYNADVKPILQNNCYSCHGNGQANGGVTLDNHAGVQAVASSGKLIGVISHAAGFKPMPQGGTKLSDCNINKIRSWINRGALSN